ncbi:MULTISPECIES: hypothetical protein [unclassified Roseitalea]|uniref:DUF7282 domain-containing protein n=1 Tax=unclassified Roseitalea TaxID=2639107 RepID=UPI00273D6EF9|nr:MULTISPECIES: hypothetical protein [unclassified Roseitalea]
MKRILMAVAATALIASPALAQDANEDDDGPVVRKDLSSANAKIEGNAVTGISAETDETVFLVLHDSAAGAPPASLGHATLQPGEYTNIRIDGTAPLDPANGVYVMMHHDTNGNSEYDFGPGMTDVDGPVMEDGGAMTAPISQ